MANRGPLGLLDLATADLVTTRRLVVPGLYHNACYHAQQAAEKSLKALLMRETGTFPKTHDVSRLVDAVRVSQPTFPELTLESAVLNEYAVDMRYE
jgi:HEPN domain-containing protein